MVILFSSQGSGQTINFKLFLKHVIAQNVEHKTHTKAGKYTHLLTCLLETMGQILNRKFCMNLKSFLYFLYKFKFSFVFAKRTFKNGQCHSLAQDRNVSHPIWYFSGIIGMGKILKVKPIVFNIFVKKLFRTILCSVWT